MFKIGDKVRTKVDDNIYSSLKYPLTVIGSPNRKEIIVKLDDKERVPDYIEVREFFVESKHFYLVESAKDSSEETSQKQAALAIPGVLDFMETQGIKNMNMEVGKYKITIEVKE